jgi:hypothetical protein
MSYTSWRVLFISRSRDGSISDGLSVNGACVARRLLGRITGRHCSLQRARSLGTNMLFNRKFVIAEIVIRRYFKPWMAVNRVDRLVVAVGDGRGLNTGPDKDKTQLPGNSRTHNCN